MKYVTREQLMAGVKGYWYFVRKLVDEFLAGRTRIALRSLADLQMAEALRLIGNLKIGVAHLPGLAADYAERVLHLWPYDNTPHEAVAAARGEDRFEAHFAATRAQNALNNIDTKEGEGSVCVAARHAADALVECRDDTTNIVTARATASCVYHASLAALEAVKEAEIESELEWQKQRLREWLIAREED
jgi:hypothetical protein